MRLPKPPLLKEQMSQAELVKTLNQWMTNLSSAMANNLTLVDNIRCEVKTVRFNRSQTPIRIKHNFGYPPQEVVVRKVVRAHPGVPQETTVSSTVTNAVVTGSDLIWKWNETDLTQFGSVLDFRGGGGATWVSPAFTVVTGGIMPLIHYQGTGTLVAANSQLTTLPIADLDLPDRYTIRYFAPLSTAAAANPNGVRTGFEFMSNGDAAVASHYGVGAYNFRNLANYAVRWVEGSGPIQSPSATPPSVSISEGLVVEMSVTRVINAGAHPTWQLQQLFWAQSGSNSGSLCSDSFFTAGASWGAGWNAMELPGAGPSVSLVPGGVNITTPQADWGQIAIYKHPLDRASFVSVDTVTTTTADARTTADAASGNPVAWTSMADEILIHDVFNVSDDTDYDITFAIMAV